MIFFNFFFIKVGIRFGNGKSVSIPICITYDVINAQAHQVAGRWQAVDEAVEAAILINLNF